MPDARSPGALPLLWAGKCDDVTDERKQPPPWRKLIAPNLRRANNILVIEENLAIDATSVADRIDNSTRRHDPRKWLRDKIFVFLADFEKSHRNFRCNYIVMI